MSEAVPEGRVQNLTKEQELRLKQVWSYLFKFWDIPVDASLVLSKAKDQEAILANGGSKNTGSGRMKLLGLFSSKKKDGSNSGMSSRRRSSASVSTRSRESIEAVYKHSMIHESLKDLDAAELREDFWKMLRCDYPDNLLLRFVRARKWDTDKAMGMIAHSLRWRITEGHPDELIRGGESAMYKADKKGVIKQLELAKATVRGFDKKGSPIVYVRPRLHHSSDQSEQDVQEYSLLIIEQARLFVKEPKESATVLFDLSGFSMANMDYGPVKFLISCFEAHYPECLGKLFIHKAPWIFPPIWNIIKNWLDPVVASKIVFTKSVKDLEEYIPAEHIPKSLGGLDDYDFDGFVRPDPSADEKMKDVEARDALLKERDAIIEKFIEATVAWIESTTDEASAKWLKAKIDLSQELCENYCKLDPYIRSRSFYDLNGTLKV